MKTGILGSLMLAFAIILTLSLSATDVSAAQLQCSLRLASCNAGETDVLHLSAQSNAHAELAGQSGFPSPYKICCSGPIAVGAACSGSYANFLDLYSPSNSHVEKPGGGGGYLNDACISSSAIRCEYTADCSTITPVSGGSAACLASISGDTNAHIGDCNTYPTKVCCWLDDTTPPAITLDYSGPTGNNWVGEGEQVTFIATATDSVTGVKEITLSVNGALRNTCASSPCIWTSPSGYSQGELVSFSATATDNVDNYDTKSSSFTRCSLNSASISPFDCGAFGCDQGNKIRITAAFSGDTCPSPSYIQLDAISSDSLCRIEALKPPANMVGMNGSCTIGSPCTGDWEIPAVPAECKNKVMTATAASIRDTINPATWRQFGFITNPTGSFTLRGAASLLTKVEASKLYVKQGTPVTLYSTTSGGTGSQRLDCTYGSAGICSGTAASNPTCSFDAPWADNGEKTIQCWVYDTGSGLYSDNRTVIMRADNTAPNVVWATPDEPAYINDGSSIAVSAQVTDPDIGAGIPGAGIPDGASCNPNIDGTTSSFTGSVLYSSATGLCSGNIILNNPSGLPEGSHTLSLDVSDNATNTVYTTRQLIIDNTPPQAWIQPLPVWKNASIGGVSFPVNWGGADINSPSGSGIKFDVQYAVFDSSGAQTTGWTDLATSTGNSTQTFGPSSPINPASYEGKNISFRVKATDQAGNYMSYERWGAVIDITPPTCQMGEPFVIASGNKFTKYGFWFVNGRYNVSWAGSDAVSGISLFDVNIEPGISGWQDITAAAYCNTTGLPSSSTSTACGVGMNYDVYNFSCRAIDAAGNVGQWSSDNISVKVDTSPPFSFFNPLYEWMGRNQSEWLGSEYFNLSWNDNDDDYPGSGVKCFYVRWSNSTMRADPDPAKRWTNLTSTYSTTDPACLNPASSARYARFGDGNTVLEDGETYNFSIMSVDNTGNAEPFDSWISSSEYSARVKNTTIDRFNPALDSWIKGSSGSIILPGYLDPSMTTYVNITSNASDNISGIYSNIIYLTIVQRSTDSYISTSSGQSDCEGGDWSTPPNGGNRTCAVRVDFSDGTTVTYNIIATDRANNTESIYGVVTTHQLANFLVHLAVLSLGTAVDIPVQVRNLETTTQNLTLGLEGFGMAAFLPADQLTMLEPCSSVGRCSNITLSPGEQKTIYVRVTANDITSAPEMLSLTAVSSSGVLDDDTALIIVSYPADFPAFDAWWAVLLMMMFAGIVFYRTEI